MYGLRVIHPFGGKTTRNAELLSGHHGPCETISAMEENFLKSITGENLSGVCFVMDYVQLQFNGSVLSAFNPLTVSAGAELYSCGGAGWADALRIRIGRTVQDAHVTDAELLVEFDDGAKFIVSLCSGDCKGPEAFMFTSPGGPIVVRQNNRSES